MHVLRGVDIDVRRGQVTALVGDNGAGKSTLIKGIAGIHAFDDGEYLFEGEPGQGARPQDANALGIEVVYQDLALCDNLDVVHNMFLGRELAKTKVLDEFAMEARARETLDGLSVRTLQSVRTAVASLSGGQRQTVAIARAVLWNSKLVILDEPTAALGVAQTEQVLKLVRRLADNGLGVILISHNLNDVFEVADDIAVLYLGAMVAQVRKADVTSSQVVELITSGRSGDIGPAAVGGRRSRPGRERGRRMSTDVDPPGDPEVPHATLGSIARDYVAKVRGGDIGSLPAVLGLLVLVVVFSTLRPDTFPGAFNFANLINQSAVVVVLAMGLVFVLLLGEIDLSAGYTGGTAAAVTGIVMTRHGWPAVPSLARRHPHRRRHRPGHRVAGGPARHPVVRRDPGVLPRPPGRAAGHDRRGRHHRLPQRGRARAEQRPDADLARLDPHRRRAARVRRPDLALQQPPAGGGAEQPADAAVGHQDRARSASSWSRSSSTSRSSAAPTRR